MFVARKGRVIGSCLSDPERERLVFDSLDSVLLCYGCVHFKEYKKSLDRHSKKGGVCPRVNLGA